MKRVLFLCVAIALLSRVVSAGEITLRFDWWGGDPRHDVTLKAIKLFEEKNPGIKVKAGYSGFNGYAERLTIQIGANTEPDVMQINWAWVDMFSHRGDGLYDLSKVKDQLNLGQFSEDMIDSGRSNGVLNALPVSMTTRFFIWNKTMWDKAGVAIPSTWDEFKAAGEVFKSKLGDDYYPSDQEPIEGLYLVDAWLHEKFGGQIIHPTEAKIGVSRDQLVEGMKFYKSLFDAHAAVSAPVRTAHTGEYNRTTEQVAEWVEGKWCGTFIWNSMFDLRSKGPREKGFEMVLGPMLTQDGKNPKPDRIGRPSMMYAIGKNCKHPEAAAKLLAFLLTDPEAATILGLNRGIPVAKSAYDALLAEGMISPMDLAGQEALEGAKMVYTNPNFEHERVRSLLIEIFETVSYGKATPEQGADRIIREVGRVLGRIAR